MLDLLRGILLPLQGAELLPGQRDIPRILKLLSSSSVQLYPLLLLCESHMYMSSMTLSSMTLRNMTLSSMTLSSMTEQHDTEQHD